MRNLTLSLGCLILSSSCLAQNLNWVQIQTSGSVPAARSNHAMAHDSKRQRTVLFGGWNGAVMSDTWEWDGRSWTQRKPKTVPTSRCCHAMTYDSARGRTIMFGGATGAGARMDLNDTWEWDGTDWTQVVTKNSPKPRRSPMIDYHVTVGRTLLFGGGTGGGGSPFFGDTWTYDGKDWTQLSPKTKPSARWAGAFAFQLLRAKTLMFGGRGAGGNVNDTWEWDGGDWTKLSPKNSPSARWLVAVAYNLSQRRVFVFGGRGNIQETWGWDGTDWAQTKVATSPSGRSDTAMVYDRARNVITLFDGTRRLADTWELGAVQTLTASPATVSIATGGTHAFSLDAGTVNASRLYWIFGSVTGTSPGVTLPSPVGSVTMPLNPDFWTDLTIALANTSLLTTTRGTLGNAGKATAAFHVPKITTQSAIGVKFYHAYLVYDASNNFYMASNPVELMLVK